tara:strand:- start:1887 stop:2096 length:210 start_codon:yes stop_codon:yes gene_type:complete
MLLIAVIASVMVVAFLIAAGSNKNIKSRTEHEADLLDKHFKEELIPPAVKVKKKKYYYKKKTNLASKVD